MRSSQKEKTEYDLFKGQKIQSLLGHRGIGKLKPSVPLEVKAEQDISFDLRIFIMYHFKKNDSSKDKGDITDGKTRYGMDF